MTRLHQLARKLTYNRIPETCPAVHAAATDAVGRFHAWLQKQLWADNLTPKQSLALEHRVGDLVADVIQGAKENGTVPLRTALVAETEENLRLRLSPDRIEAVENGQDLSAEELLQA